MKKQHVLYVIGDEVNMKAQKGEIEIGLFIAITACAMVGGLFGYLSEQSHDKVKIACYEAAKVNTNLKCDGEDK